jgi:hypothetical protein
MDIAAVVSLLSSRLIEVGTPAINSEVLQLGQFNNLDIGASSGISLCHLSEIAPPAAGPSCRAEP